VNQRLVHHWPCILLALALIVGTAATASAYTRPTTSPPTDADMVLINGHSWSMGIRILNLTPYEIVEDMSGITAKGSTNISRKTHKSMMFAPVGWPIKLPAVPGKWNPDVDTGLYTFQPDSPNYAIHPYSFAVAWDDQGGYVTNSTLGWTIKGVYTNAQGKQTKDVGLRMWFTRVKPDKPLLGADFKFISACIVQFVDVIGVALDPANPIAWLDVFVATKELKNAAFEVANSEETGGDKMYFASYVLPDPGSDVDMHGPNWDPATRISTSDSNDGVDAQWTDAAGHYASTIVVTTHLLRGDDVDTSGGGGFGCCGTAPIAQVTVWTSDQWEYGRAANALSPLVADFDGLRINSLLRQGDRSQRMQRYLQFAMLYNSMDAKQIKAYREAFEKLVKHQRLTGKLKNLLQTIATALEEGTFSLKGKWKP
jgi:hypothetical protein